MKDCPFEPWQMIQAKELKEALANVPDDAEERERYTNGLCRIHRRV